MQILTRKTKINKALFWLIVCYVNLRREARHLVPNPKNRSSLLCCRMTKTKNRSRACKEGGKDNCIVSAALLGKMNHFMITFYFFHMINAAAIVRLEY